MNFRKVLIFVSVVFLFASCEFMNQKDSFVQELKKTETAEIVVSNESESFDSNVKTGKVLINIGGANARMIRPNDSLKLDDYSEWHVWFEGVSDFDYDLETFNQSFILPVGNYNVLVTAVNKIEGKEGGDLILSSIQGKSRVNVVAGETVSTCNILMERTKTEDGVGSFEYKFKISKFCFSAFSTKYNPDNPEQVIDFTPKNYIKASLNGLTVSENYIFDADQSDNFYVEVLSEKSEDDQFYVFSLNGIDIKSGFYRLKIDFETSNNTYIDSFNNETEFYTKALFEYPESLVEISDGAFTKCYDTENEKIHYEEFNDDHSIDLKKLEKILKTCDKNDERVLEINNLKETSYYFPVSKLNDLIIKKGIKVDVTMPEYFDDTSSFKDNPYLYGVTFESSGYFILPSGFFKNCSGLKYVRFQQEISIYEGNKYPWLEIEEGVFEDCGIITFQVPEESRELYNQIFMDYFGEGNYKIESIQPYFDLFEIK